jgi:transcription termination factor Rho
MELRLDRNLSEKRIFPAIDISKSGTRKEELLLNEKELNAIYALRKAISNIGAAEAADMIIEKLSKSKDNESFIASLKID